MCASWQEMVWWTKLNFFNLLCTRVKFCTYLDLFLGIPPFFERVSHKIFARLHWSQSSRNSTWFTRQLFLMRGHVGSVNSMCYHSHVAFNTVWFSRENPAECVLKQAKPNNTIKAKNSPGPRPSKEHTTRNLLLSFEISLERETTLCLKLLGDGFKQKGILV